jgi:hypothetical protein
MSLDLPTYNQSAFNALTIYAKAIFFTLLNAHKRAHQGGEKLSLARIALALKASACILLGRQMSRSVDMEYVGSDFIHEGTCWSVLVGTQEWGCRITSCDEADICGYSWDQSNAFIHPFTEIEEA